MLQVVSLTVAYLKDVFPELKCNLKSKEKAYELQIAIPVTGWTEYLFPLSLYPYTKSIYI